MAVKKQRRNKNSDVERSPILCSATVVLSKAGIRRGTSDPWHRGRRTGSR